MIRDDQSESGAETAARAATSGLLARSRAAWKSAANLASRILAESAELIPWGYEDDRGFHFGAHMENSNWASPDRARLLDC